MSDYRLTATDVVVRIADSAHIPNDRANRDRVEYETWLANGGVPDPYVPPPAPVPEIVTDVQFFAALAHAGSITQDEAIAAVSTGTIPATILAAVDALPADQKFTAKMKISGQTTFMRSSPIVAALGASLGWTSAQIDDLWRAASAL